PRAARRAALRRAARAARALALDRGRVGDPRARREAVRAAAEEARGPRQGPAGGPPRPRARRGPRALNGPPHAPPPPPPPALPPGDGDLALALAPALLLGALLAAWKLPLRHAVLMLTFLALTLENPSDVPAWGRWRSPLYPAGALLLAHMNVTFPGQRWLLF